MKYIDNRHITNPSLNLALEEYLLRHVASEEPLLLFYINEPAVIIGRNQVTLNEIDADFIKANGIHVVRRLSGGGAVFHDHGNLNFSFVTNDDSDIHNFAKFIEPVVEVLNRLGVPAELRGASDVFVDNKKISGNAQFASRGRLFSHGTLLFDTDLETMLKALNPRQNVIETNAVQSIRNFVTNIRDWLPEEMTIEALKEAILAGIFKDNAIDQFELTPEIWDEVGQMAQRRYRNWEWTYGRSPQFNVQKSETFSSGQYDVRLQVERGYIEEFALFGNFAGRLELEELTVRFKHQRYDRDAVEQWLRPIDLEPYLGPISHDEFLSLLF